MENPEIFCTQTRHVLPDTPSDQIAGLIRDRSDLLNASGSTLCSLSPINIVGSLLIQQGLGASINNIVTRYGFEDKTLEIIQLLDKPFEILDEVSLYDLDPHLRDYSKKVTDSSGTILMKYCPGERVGLILEGSYSGLILRTHNSFRYPAEGMRIIRLFNDECVLNRGFSLPYSPLEEPQNRYKNSEEWQGLLADVRQSIETQFHQAAKRTAHTLDKEVNPQSTNPLWVSDMISQLLIELGYNFDLSNLHVTRPIGTSARR